jgi:hypothetical protein
MCRRTPKEKSFQSRQQTIGGNVAKNKDKQRGISTDELKKLQGKLREGILHDILALDPKAVSVLTVNARIAAESFSDWHDRFGDGGGFGDGFGKAGDQKLGLTTRVDPSGLAQLPGRAVNPKK